MKAAFALLLSVGLVAPALGVNASPSLWSDEGGNRYSNRKAMHVGDLITVMVIESSNPGVYRYHILHGVINPIEGIGPDDLKIPQIKERIEKEGIREIIIATNPNIEGNTTAHYIAEIAKPYDVTITRIASGVPVGGDIVYIDPLTIKSALKNRRKVSEGL